MRMRAPFLFASFAFAIAFTAADSASAADSECPLGEIGQACGAGDTCIPATCCDDPNGCAYDAGSSGSGSGGGAGSSSSGSGGSTGAGVSYACGLCTFTGEPYCAAADVGNACADGGVCQFSGGGAESVPESDGGTSWVSFSFTGCGPNDVGGDGGGFSGSGGSGGGSSSGSGSGAGGTGTGSGSSGGAVGSSGSSSSGSSGSSGGSGGSGETTDGGTGKGTVTAGCTIAPRSTPWSAVPFAALALAAIARRRRYFT